MKFSFKHIVHLGILISFLALSGCGLSIDQKEATSIALTAAAATSTYTLTPDPTSTPLPPTTTPTSTPTAKPPTETIEPLPGILPEGIIVTYKGGSSCTIDGPAELAPGEYTFVLIQPPPKINELGIPVGGHLDVQLLIDGNTTRDLLDHPNYQQGTWWSQALELLSKVKPVDGWTNESRNEKYYTYFLEPGEHIVDRWTQNPHFYWYCGSLNVK